MKGLSILLTLALLLLAHQLSLYMKRLGTLRSAARARSLYFVAHPEVQLEARTNSRGLGPRRFPAFRADGRVRTWSRERLEQFDETTLAF